MNKPMRQSIKNMNTFGIEMDCNVLVISTIDQAISFLKQNKEPFYILGGGSNVLFQDNFEDLILKNEIKGIEILEENEDDVLIEIASGEVWHEFVLWALDHNYYGIENLSLIPGTVGAAPMQNIGAYGVELKDVLEYVEYINLEDNNIQKLSAEACFLGYRDSIFKQKLKNKSFITKVGVRLSKKVNVNASYGAINDKLNAWEISNPTPQDMSNAIIEIRKSKLPDPLIIGNAGSFFKNVIVTPEIISELKSYYPDIPYYPTETTDIKIPTAWLIDQCGWKGKRLGHVGTHVNHALVLVNYGEGTGEELVNLANDIQQSVWEKFSIEITPEVNIVE